MSKYIIDIVFFISILEILLLGHISFKNNGISPGIEKPQEFKNFLVSILTSEGCEFKLITYIFCKDEYLLSLNRQYLNHDTLTDILTFTLSGKNMPVVAEIYISIQRVRENAENFNASFSNELQRVMIHGILHLCGYSDHTKKLREGMRKKEDFYLNRSDFT